MPVFKEEVVKVEEDCVLKELLRPCQNHETEILTQQALELMCGAILLVLERQCTDQLPGGKYHNPTNEMKMQSSSVPTSNIISERDFAIFDNLLKAKPNASVTALEALIMWSNNKPPTWLASLGRKERAQALQDARLNIPKIREKMRMRRFAIIKERKEKLEENRKKLEEKRNELKKKKINLTLKLETLGGLWRSEQAICAALNDFKSEKDKTSALYIQLQFHHLVLNSVSPKAFYFQKSHSEKGKKVDFDFDTTSD